MLIKWSSINCAIHSTLVSNMFPFCIETIAYSCIYRDKGRYRWEHVHVFAGNFNFFGINKNTGTVPNCAYFSGIVLFFKNQSCLIHVAYGDSLPRGSKIVSHVFGCKQPTWLYVIGQIVVHLLLWTWNWHSLTIFRHNFWVVTGILYQQILARLLAVPELFWHSPKLCQFLKFGVVVSIFI